MCTVTHIFAPHFNRALHGVLLIFIDKSKISSEMGVTRLKRKDLRNKSKAKNRVKGMKQLTATPVIKNVDIEELKASFEKPAKKAASAKPAKEEKPVEAKKEADSTEKE